MPWDQAWSSIQEFAGIIYLTVDFMRSFYIIQGFSLWQLFTISIWISIILTILFYALDKLGN